MEQTADQSSAPGGFADSAGTANQSDARESDLKNMKKIGSWHGAAALAALTLFGAAHTWAATSGWLLAELAALGAAFLAAMVLSSIVHEWGHFFGAKLSGSIAPVLSKPRRLYFMFNFDMEANSVRQALWMSWGGLTGSWSLVVVLFLLVPIDSWAAALLVATATGRAVNATVFELPIIQRTRHSGEFRKELMAQLDGTGIVQLPGLVAGLVSLVALV